MTNAELFIDKYKQLEEVVRSTYKLRRDEPIADNLIQKGKYQRYANDIHYCREVRNLLSHNRKVNDGFAVEPSQQMLDFVDRLIEQIKHRTKCHEIQISIGQVYWQPVDGNVKETMIEMREKMYTHVPILDDGVVVGVFDENSIFNYLATEEIIAVDKELTFKDIKDYISIEGREMEEFLFFKATSYVEELEQEFEKAFRNGKRIGVAFLTTTGKAKEKLQGIITPWDIIAASK